MALTLEILGNLRGYIDAGYAALQGEKPALGVIANASGQEVFAREVAEQRRKDALLDRRLQKVSFKLEDAACESKVGSEMTISIVERFESIVVIAGKKESVDGVRTHVFDVLKAGMDNWLVVDHRVSNGARPASTSAEEKTIVSPESSKPNEKRSWKQEPKKEALLGVSTGQIAMLIGIALVLVILFVPYSNRTEICLETGAKRKSVSVAGIQLVNKQIETDLSRWIAQQGATPKNLSWSILEGREGRAFGSKVTASSRATNAVTILEKIKAKGDAGKDLLLQFQDIQQRRARGKNVAGLSPEEKRKAVQEATTAGKEYLQLLKKLGV